MSDIVIRAERLGKKYIIGRHAQNDSYLALRDVLMKNAKSVWSKTRDLLRGNPVIQGDAMEEVWALKDVSFEIQRGEAVGIIGRNGAGKSTLLKILSRITEPSAGRVAIDGRVVSLLEVGTGFHPELSGRENIYLNGTILGMTRKEIKRKFDEIVAFAEVEKYLDTPVKRYSSGMYVRLAFAVAAHLEPEILVVDEVLAVGDLSFQKKCLGKMEDVARGGRTVLFVSHNMGAIQMLCRKTMLLKNGSLVMIRDSGDAIAQYLSDSRKDREGQIRLAPTGSDAFFTGISIRNSSGEICSEIDVSRSLTISFEYKILRPIRGLEVSFSLFNQCGSKIFYCPQSTSIHHYKNEYPPGEYVGSVEIPGNFLAPGSYTITAGIHQPNIQLFDGRQHVIGFQIVECGSQHYAFDGQDIGSVLVDFPWRIRCLPDGENVSVN
jgi:lipopolysaccharide transport system ATP-binding protein